MKISILLKFLINSILLIIITHAAPLEFDLTLKKLNNFSVEDEPNSTQGSIWEELKKVKFKNN